jgi:histone deacetylase 11
MKNHFLALFATLSFLAHSASATAPTDRPPEFKPHGRTFFETGYRIADDKLPIFFSPKYTPSLFGLEKFHYFDNKKYQKIYDQLVRKNVISPKEISAPAYPDDDFLVRRTENEKRHSREYLRALKKSAGTIAEILVFPLAKLFPAKWVYRRIAEPQRLATGGTAMATRAALERGWAINLAGGYHHADRVWGEGFCIFADISLAIENLRASGSAQKIMIVDLDVHMGNGHEYDYGTDPDVFILDMFNQDVWPQPHDTLKTKHDLRNRVKTARLGIDRRIEIRNGYQDAEYIADLEEGLADAFARFTPDLVIYNAGTDILRGDPLGKASVSPEGVIRRDEIVFETAKRQGVPITMLLSGGYQKTNAAIIADSIENLFRKGLIGR